MTWATTSADSPLGSTQGRADLLNTFGAPAVQRSEWMQRSLSQWTVIPVPSYSLVATSAPFGRSTRTLRRECFSSGKDHIGTELVTWLCSSRLAAADVTS